MYRSYGRIVISGCEPVVVQIAVLRVASGNSWLARPPNPAEPRLADARRWAALAAHGLNRLAAASRHLAGSSGYLWIGGAVGIRSLNAVTVLAGWHPPCQWAPFFPPPLRFDSLPTSTTGTSEYPGVDEGGGAESSVLRREVPPVQQGRGYRDHEQRVDEKRRVPLFLRRRGGYGPRPLKVYKEQILGGWL
ncbi:hypothetical protein C8R44DRAFT_868137 [Mycena epipterygia]|nr:hypothetical protein C8R44DRAFT_868137 [Mycena epipterygia]